jgi:2-polyprenyl-3-methyl-5-hydroxy-6-metoxy-1,4-benzoquinol methylase
MLTDNKLCLSERTLCPLCGTDTEKSVPLGMSIVKCSACSLIYNQFLPNATKSAAWEKYTFDEKISCYDLSRIDFFRYFWAYICHIIGKKTGSLLDVGCGRGLLLNIAKASGWQVEGIEVSPALSRYANRYSGCTIHQGLIEEIELPQNSYDIIMLVDVFRTLSDPIRALENCKRLRKPNGAIVLREFNILHKDSMGSFMRSGEISLQCLSPLTARAFFNKIGITDVQILPSPMSLMTIPLVANSHLISRRILMKTFNVLIQMCFKLSFNKWITIVPEMLVIGFANKRK